MWRQNPGGKLASARRIRGKSVVMRRSGEKGKWYRRPTENGRRPGEGWEGRKADAGPHYLKSPRKTPSEAESAKIGPERKKQTSDRIAVLTREVVSRSDHRDPAVHLAGFAQKRERVKSDQVQLGCNKC